MKVPYLSSHAREDTRVLDTTETKTKIVVPYLSSHAREDARVVDTRAQSLTATAGNLQLLEFRFFSHAEVEEGRCASALHNNE